MRESEPRLAALQFFQVAPASFAFTILLGLFAALPALSIDLSAPTLPLLPRVLQTTVTMAELTLSCFMVGFALGQLGAGRFSDARGRRPVLLAGLACFTLSGIACSLAQSGLELLAARCVQGFGAGSCAVISFAMVQDLFEGEAARAKRSYVATVLTAVPVLAPALGSVLVDRFGWRSVHVVLAVGGTVLLAAVGWCVPESLRGHREVRQRAGGDGRTSLWNDRVFLRTALVNALSYGVIFSYIAGSPIIIIRQMGYPPAVFAAVFASTAVALTLGAASSGMLARRGISAEAAIRVGLIVTVAAALGLAGFGLAGISAAIILPPLLVVLFCRGILVPNLQHVAIERWSERAGTASALVGVSQLLGGAFASVVVAALLPYLRLNAVLVPMAVLAAAACLMWRPARP
ncbi:MAG TPA: multidrug effflux MFS transporter [Acetobacteraceae bacterium]|nr:multidrug effflux MFS transporter [Acetobacteraceae bacterium]